VVKVGVEHMVVMMILVLVVLEQPLNGNLVEVEHTLVVMVRMVLIMEVLEVV
tara:strand:+ start:473 stop:628 length:156 start_codon:yes stop_codon:yes gene_type:complete